MKRSSTEPDTEKKSKVHKRTSYNPHYSDNWDTPRHAYEDIKPFVEQFQNTVLKDKLIIWDPFYNAQGGTAKQYLEQVFPDAIIIHNNHWIDLDAGLPAFAQDCNLIITNPPYSKKNKQATTQWLQSLDIPFMTLIPNESMMLKGMRPLMADVQLIVPQGRYVFEKNGEKTKSAPLGTSWFCFNCQLERDLNFL